MLDIACGAALSLMGVKADNDTWHLNGTWTASTDMQQENLTVWCHYDTNINVNEYMHLNVKRLGMATTKLDMIPFTVSLPTEDLENIFADDI